MSRKKQKQNFRRPVVDLLSPEEVLTVIGAHYLLINHFTQTEREIFDDLGITIENFNLEETIIAALDYVGPIKHEKLN